MIRIRFTMDSKRAGEVEHVRTLAAAKRKIRCPRPKFTPEKIHGYANAWEVTCGDTVVADAMQLPPGARADYHPKYKVRNR
jgi:hypothetical protein